MFFTRAFFAATLIRLSDLQRSAGTIEPETKRTSRPNWRSSEERASHKTYAVLFLDHHGVIAANQEKRVAKIGERPPIGCDIERGLHLCK